MLDSPGRQADLPAAGRADGRTGESVRGPQHTEKSLACSGAARRGGSGERTGERVNRATKVNQASEFVAQRVSSEAPLLHQFEPKLKTELASRTREQRPRPRRQRQPMPQFAEVVVVVVVRELERLEGQEKNLREARMELHDSRSGLKSAGLLFLMGFRTALGSALEILINSQTNSKYVSVSNLN